MVSEIRKVTGTSSAGISSIDTELRRLWENEAFIGAGSDSVSSTRVCTANLIIFASCADLLETAVKAVESIAGENPLRVICLLTDDNANETSVDITGFCRLIDGGGVRICCEQITITGNSNSSSELASSAAELVSPGLPVFLWWMCGAYTGIEAYEILVSLADKVLLDSSILAPSDNALSVISQLMNAHKGVSFSDINWHRITHWRETLARFFDEPVYNPCLFKITRVEIHSQKDKNGIYHSAYLAGWLQSRLGWRIQKTSIQTDKVRQLDMLNTDGSPISVIIYHTNANPQQNDGITSIHITCDNDLQFQFNFTQDDNDISITVSDTDNKVESLQYKIELHTIEEIISFELQTLTEDPVFKESLNAAIKTIN